jgi:hypothetical protein
MMDEEESVHAAICPFCLEEIVVGVVDDPSNRGILASDICSSSTHTSSDIIHQKCLEWFIFSKINKSTMGICPMIPCPYNHKNEVVVLNFVKWKDLVDQRLVCKYYDQADNILTILCGSCHTISYLSVSFDPEGSLKPHDDDTLVDVNEVHKVLKTYDYGLISTEDIYREIMHRVYPKEFSKVLLINKPQWLLFKSILSLIQSPERRCSLQLRYIRDYPTVYTRCCDFLHCFRCKSKGSHIGKSCEENMKSFDSSIVSCPNCHIAIAKGDGCNTIVCACGKQFSWEYEKEMNRRLMNFLASHPNNTSDACARVLCRLLDGNLDWARAWRTKHLLETNDAFLKIWKEKYPLCPHQAASLSSIRGSYENEGFTFARDAWLNTYTQEARKHQKSNVNAKSHLFESLCLQNNDPGRFAHILLNSMYFPIEMIPNLNESINQWLSEHKDLGAKGKHDMEVAAAFQFLMLYGNQPIASDLLMQVNCPAVSQWDIDLSNQWLKYSQDKTTATREGSISCYPAVFAQLQGPRSSLTVCLEHASRGSNWLTFGLCERGKLGSSNSNGVGRSVNTWGICDDRSRTTDIPARIFACGEPITRMRQLDDRDELKATVDTLKCWLDLFLNDEHLLRLPIPAVENYSKYLFAMTLANNHTARIVNNQIFVSKGLINASHKDMYQSAVQLCRSIDAEEWQEEHWFRDHLKRFADEWLAIFANNESAAASAHLGLMALIANTGIVDMRNQKTIKNQESEIVIEINFQVTWTNILRALCWNRIRRASSHD